MDEPPKRPPEPYLHVRSVKGSLFAEAIAFTGNAHALLKLRSQIDWVLEGAESYPFEEGVYNDVHGQPFEVATRYRLASGEF